MKRYRSLLALLILPLLVSTALLSDPKLSKGSGKSGSGSSQKSADSLKMKRTDPEWLKKNPNYKPAWNSPEWVKPKVVPGC